MSTAPSMLEVPTIGRPRKLQDIADFEAEIEAYFAGRDAAGKPYTMHGLARHLDCSRNTLLRYEEYNDAAPFCRAIKRARERVAEWTEDRLHTKGYHPAGAIFSLKNNFGWQDVQHVETESRSIVIGLQATPEQIRGILPAVPGVQIAQIPSINGEVVQAGDTTLSPPPETLSAPSPVPQIAVSGDNSEAKATPNRGVSPASVAE